MDWTTWVWVAFAVVATVILDMRTRDADAALKRMEAKLEAISDQLTKIYLEIDVRSSSD